MKIRDDRQLERAFKLGKRKALLFDLKKHSLFLQKGWGKRKSSPGH
jgi:hypothetical protein